MFILVDVPRIEQRLSDMWTKSTTEIKDGLDEILQIRQPEAMADKRLRRVSRPHRPKDRMTKTIEVDAMETVDEKASLSMSGRALQIYIGMLIIKKRVTKYLANFLQK